VGSEGNWQIIEPTNEWKSMKTSINKEAFAIATNLYFVDVEKQ
jgi:hypothetical protein